jgi:glutamine synthetase
VLRRDGQPFAGDPRSALQRQLERAADRGYDYTAGIEMEFYLLREPEPSLAAPLPATDAAGYFDVGEDELASTRNEIVDTLATMGIGVGGAHHETGPGQQELDLHPTGGIAIADQIVTTRQVIRTIAERRNLRATFMPKPFPDAPGSGMHVFQRLLRLADGGDALRGAGDDLSPTGRHAIAGLIERARIASAVWSPSVNSYKRLAAGHRAPRHATWARLSQASLIRVPVSGPSTNAKVEIELRSPDNMANPYLAFALALACMLDGIERGEEPPPALDENLVRYDDEELERLGIPRLPTTMGQALDLFAEDPMPRAALGDYVCDGFLHAKRAEWEEYRRHVSPWEQARYGV